MEYPNHLLPKDNYKIINFDEVNRGFNYLVRHTNEKDINDEDGSLKAELIVAQSDHLRDYSTNLLGIFQLTDLQWQYKKATNCTALWNSDLQAYHPTENDVEYIEEKRGSFFLNISTIHQFSFPTRVEQEGEQNIKCCVLHTPTRSNFWHCSLRWYCNEEDSLKWNKGRMNRMKALIRSFIAEKAELKEPNYQAIDPRAYLL